MRLAPSPIFLQGLSKFDNFYPWKFHQISIFTSCVGELWKIWLFSHHALENFGKYDWLNPFEIEVIKEYCIRCNIFLGFFFGKLIRNYKLLHLSNSDSVIQFWYISSYKVLSLFEACLDLILSPSFPWKLKSNIFVLFLFIFKFSIKKLHIFVFYKSDLSKNKHFIFISK